VSTNDDKDSIDPLNASELEEEIAADTRVLADAIGGWRGAIDSAIPTVVFLVAFVVTKRNLQSSVAAALLVGLGIAVMRVARRESLQQVISGLAGLALSAFIAVRTGRSENFFLLPIIQNGVYSVACLVSLLVRRPLLGYIVSALRGRDSSWRSEPGTYRQFAAATWLWTLVFALRVAITAPLYATGQLEVLGVAKIILGWPLYALAVVVTLRVVREVKQSHQGNQ
jgi:hypothetical protein